MSLIIDVILGSLWQHTISLSRIGLILGFDNRYNMWLLSAFGSKSCFVCPHLGIVILSHSLTAIYFMMISCLCMSSLEPEKWFSIFCAFFQVVLAKARVLALGPKFMTIYLNNFAVSILSLLTHLLVLSWSHLSLSIDWEADILWWCWRIGCWLVGDYRYISSRFT